MSDYTVLEVATILPAFSNGCQPHILVPDELQILSLYKQLLRYGDLLVFTDKNYYKQRIKREFYDNKESPAEEIKFLYERKNVVEEKKDNLTDKKMLRNSQVSSRSKRTVDKSLFPTVNENDIEEYFIKGGGPGGQKVNKSNNCVQLIHKPTGLVVKVHESREQAKNRKIAREKLAQLLDKEINKENSVEAQLKKILEEKSKKKLWKQKKLTEMKMKWKEIIAEYQKEN